MSKSESPTVEQMKLAFCWHLARRIVQADTVVQVAESEWLQERFPEQDLRAAGLTDESGSESKSFNAILGQAMVDLPDVLDLQGKFEVLKALFDATLADAEFHHREGDALVNAGRLLGMSTTEIEQFLSEQAEVGEVELPDPE